MAFQQIRKPLFCDGGAQHDFIPFLVSDSDFLNNIDSKKNREQNVFTNALLRSTDTTYASKVLSDLYTLQYLQKQPKCYAAVE